MNLRLAGVYVKQYLDIDLAGEITPKEPNMPDALLDVLPVTNQNQKKTVNDFLQHIGKPKFTHKTICKATTTQIIKSWYYLIAPIAITGLWMDCDGELWCSNCQIQVDIPIPRFSIRLRVEDPTETTIFEVPDFKIQKILRCTTTKLLRLEEKTEKLPLTRR
ncbi:uncharacterized protein LOC113322576 [Papaver somniferum]|uniref:uncharacterized protein LOC113322576 n=1 Tax=Papaver somniferum TaxID=3469 RepID=UPI000E6FBB71|nr:uncharacterized protein LOC113322576 [Papaver somniferum]